MTDIITVEASKKYDVIVGSGILVQLPEFLGKLKHFTKVMIVTDDNVSKIYLKTVKNILKKAEIPAFSFIFNHGEENKTMKTVEKILEYMAEKHFERNDMVIALGGGIVGDVAGFASSCYQRGSRYVQIPTTLLACVDSSVGGKTAVNLKSGKNLAGQFYQPEMTVCDISLLETLPKNEFSNGMAEVIKYGMLFDEGVITDLENSYCLEDLVSKSVQFKANIVKSDEFDNGQRHLLNFGHTIGHAIEKQSGYEIEHGQAVAIGMCLITKAAEKSGICQNGTYERLVSILKKFNLPTYTELSFEELSSAIKSDKKIENNMMKAILPRKIGDCFVEKMDMETFYHYLKLGIEE